MWYVLLTVVSCLVAVVGVFTIKDVAYLSSTFSVTMNDPFFDTYQVLFYALEASENFVVIVFLCSVVYIFLTEYILVRRVFRLKQQEQSGFGKAFIRLVYAQVISVVVFIASMLGITAIATGVAAVYGYIDLTKHTKTALEGVVTDDVEIIKRIMASQTRVEVYDAKGASGVVLAQRDLKKQETHTLYSGVILPLLAKISGGTTESKNYYVPQTESVVYTHFVKGNTDDIIIQLAYNQLRHSQYPFISRVVTSYEVPQVTYLDDEQYVQRVSEKVNEIHELELKEFESIIQENTHIVKECTDTERENASLIAEQEKEYRENCEVNTRYSDCEQLKRGINENKVITQEGRVICEENRKILAGQLAELEQDKKKINDGTIDLLEQQKYELSNGMYFPKTKNIYMRVVEGQDSYVYLSTLLHELFHHYSRNMADIPEFVDEGITDYLALKSFGLSDYQIAHTSGYFKEVQIVQALLEKIPEDELIAVYVAQSDTDFKGLFATYFPAVKYDEFVSKGDVIFNETYEVEEGSYEQSLWDTNADHPSVQDMRKFLGLEKNKFY